MILTLNNIHKIDNFFLLYVINESEKCFINLLFSKEINGVRFFSELNLFLFTQFIKSKRVLETLKYLLTTNQNKQRFFY